MKWICILGLAAAVIALPFLCQRMEEAEITQKGIPEVVVITPHNEDIRNEFAEGFSKWHAAHFGTPVRVDWRVIGGTTEIMRYLTSEYQASAAAYARNQERIGHKVSSDEAMSLDTPDAVTCRIDVFFGGGDYDHSRAERMRLTVPAWPEGKEPDGLFRDSHGRELIPVAKNGATWRGKAFYGNVLSTFGICYNFDRLHDLKISREPRHWDDLAAPEYFGYVGLADPTKSGSVAKAFELIVYTQCAKAVAAAGFTREQIAAFEAKLAAAKTDYLKDGSIPHSYYEAIETGWLNGIRLIRRLGANARSFSEAAGKVPVDVGNGSMAAGICIDFYGRLQAENSTLPDGRAVMRYVTPIGEAGITADPISLLRGAPNRELAVRFIEFVLGREGQKLWCLRPGSEGGPHRKALRRLPIRREFYPSDDPDMQAFYEANKAHYSDPLGDLETDAYRLGEAFVYWPRWTLRHFGIQRDLIRAMCMDSGEELRAAWRAILQNGGVEKNPEAMQFLEAMPTVPVLLTWNTAISVFQTQPRLERLANWTAFFRKQYRMARRAAGAAKPPK
ncbi:MAG: ABC transporter substrate-binding protein [Kiritimatiellae bacterium]|nr:ABC transporter substrate-binding protein [Kiritimatiellia bacterium]